MLSTMSPGYIPAVVRRYVPSCCNGAGPYIYTAQPGHRFRSGSLWRTTAAKTTQNRRNMAHRGLGKDLLTSFAPSACPALRNTHRSTMAAPTKHQRIDESMKNQ